MSKGIIVLLALLLTTLVGCAQDDDKREGMFEQHAAALKRDLDLEIKAKMAHAVREEQYKQRLKQLERDYAKAIAALSTCKK